MKTRSSISLLLHLNAALGSGSCNHVTVADVKRRVLERTIFDMLQLHLGEVYRFETLTKDAMVRLNEEWEGMVRRYDERSVFGVERNGFCLLMAYILEGIRRRTRETDP